MSSRGLYRGIFSALLDDPDFQRLSSQARHALLTLRLCPQNTVASIFRFYPDVLRAQTGYDAKTLERALQELEREGWLVREGVVVWIRNGLRYDPTIKLADPKHEKAVKKAVAGLPKLEVVLKFCDYYKIERPFDGPPKGLARALGDPSSPIPIPTPIPTPNISRPLEGPALVSGNGLSGRAKEVLDYLSQVARRPFRPVEATLRPIVARLNSGTTVEQCKAVIDHRARKWRGDPKMDEYLRPQTLFRPANFESYLAEAKARPLDDDEGDEE